MKASALARSLGESTGMSNFAACILSRTSWGRVSCTWYYYKRNKSYINTKFSGRDMLMCFTSSAFTPPS